jgi:hypothetical protein
MIIALIWITTNKKKRPGILTNAGRAIGIVMSSTSFLSFFRRGVKRFYEFAKYKKSGQSARKYPRIYAVGETGGGGLVCAF